MKNSIFLKLTCAFFVSLGLFSCGNNQNNSTNTSDSTIEETSYVHQKDHYKVACVGDSLTAGHMWPSEAYPVYLDNYLKSNFSDVTYEVKNCGVNGISITGYGGTWNDPNKSYIKQQIYQDTVSFQPDIIAVFLGTNDATGWSNAKDIFKQGYIDLLNSFRNDISEDVQFILMTSPNTTGSNQFNIPGDVIVEEVNPIQRDIAFEEDLTLLDISEYFSDHENFPSLIRSDKVHLSISGAQYIAQLLGEAIYGCEN